MAMFSNAQLEKFDSALTRKCTSQSTFDEAVKENVEEFDMDVEEALQSAIIEFKSLGVDLSNIYTGSKLESHPMYQCCRELKVNFDLGNTDLVRETLLRLFGHIATGLGSSDEEKEEISSVLLASGACPLVIACLKLDSLDNQTIVQSLGALKEIVLISKDLQDSFVDANGIDILFMEHAILEVSAASFHLGAAIASRNESGKRELMSINVPQKIGKALITAMDLQENQRKLLSAISSLVIALTSADDDTQPGSSAFSNARDLAKTGVARTIVTVLNSLWGKKKEFGSRSGYEELRSITCDLCRSLRQVAATDEICCDIVDIGLLPLMDRILCAGLQDLERHEPRVSKVCLSLYRQIIASDRVKYQLDVDHFVGMVCNVIELSCEEFEFSSSVLEQAFGVLTVYFLRNAEASERAVDLGCGRIVIIAMNQLLEFREKKSKCRNVTARALRQGCMALRNLASRSPRVRQALIDIDAIVTIRSCQQAAPKQCNDVGDAAIRDINS